MNIVVVLRRHWLPLWHPFFERLVTWHDVQLTVITPPEQSRGVPELVSIDAGGGATYRHASVPVRLRIYDHEAPMLYSAPFEEVIAAAEPDLIYVIGEAGYLCTYQVVRLAARLPRRPRVCLYAAQNIVQKWPPPFRQTERFCFGQIDMLFPLGEEHEAVARHKGYEGPAVQVPLGVDQQVFRPQPARDSSTGDSLLPWPKIALDDGSELPAPAGLRADARPLVGFVGKLTHAKGIDTLLTAAAQTQPQPRLLLIGRGPAEQELRTLAGRLGVADSVTWLPEAPHRMLPDYYGAMDVLVLPSRQISHSALHWWYPVAGKEQFGRVLTEAMACERPVIGSDCGEIPRVIGDTGLVFAQGDAAGLARHLTTLLGDPALCQDFGRRGRRRVLEHYTWDKVTQQYYNAWCDLLQTRQQAPSRMFA